LEWLLSWHGKHEKSLLGSLVRFFATQYQFRNPAYLLLLLLLLLSLLLPLLLCVLPGF
jgi:hypothetical protein